jgi:hypothetical protein
VNPVNRLYACVSGGSGAYTWTIISVNIPRYHTIDPVLWRIHCYKFTQPRKSLVMFLLKTLLTIALGLTPIFSNSIRNCRCTSGSECWPSDSEFQTFASQVSQPLIHPAPPALPCYNPASKTALMSALTGTTVSGVLTNLALLNSPTGDLFQRDDPSLLPQHYPRRSMSIGGCPSSALTPEPRKISR